MCIEENLLLRNLHSCLVTIPVTVTSLNSSGPWRESAHPFGYNDMQCIGIDAPLFYVVINGPLISGYVVVCTPREKNHSTSRVRLVFSHALAAFAWTSDVLLSSCLPANLAPGQSVNCQRPRCAGRHARHHNRRTKWKCPLLFLALCAPSAFSSSQPRLPIAEAP